MYNQAPEAGLASLLASRGRKGDSVLVHMAPEEVAGLQQLAMAHGGSLTVNPETGLYEANFLKKILPVLAGAALGPAGFGMFGSAMTAGLAVGAATALIEGDLKKGLMAGLGAYSGANISQALGKAAEAAVPAAPAPQDVAKVTQATEAAKNTFGAGPEAVNLAKPPISVPATPAGFDQMAAAARAGVSQASAPTGLAGLAQGAKGLFSSPQARSAFGTALGGPISKYATLAGAMDAMTPEVKPPTQAQLGEDMFYIPGQVNPNYGKGYSESYFLPGQYYKKTPQGMVPTNPFAKAPGYANGGVVAPFGGQQAAPAQPGMIPAPNPNYPLATVMQTNYAANPQSREVVGSYQEPINPYTGEQRFADGGPVDTSAVMAYVEELNRRAKNPVVAKYDTAPAQVPFNPFDTQPGQGGGGFYDLPDPRPFNPSPSAVPAAAIPPDVGGLNWSSIGNVLKENPLTEEQLSKWEQANLEDTQNQITPVKPDPTTPALVDEALGNESWIDRGIGPVTPRNAIILGATAINPFLGMAAEKVVNALAPKIIVPDESYVSTSGDDVVSESEAAAQEKAEKEAAEKKAAEDAARAEAERKAAEDAAAAAAQAQAQSQPVGGGGGGGGIAAISSMGLRPTIGADLPEPRGRIYIEEVPTPPPPSATSASLMNEFGAGFSPFGAGASPFGMDRGFGGPQINPFGSFDLDAQGEDYNFGFAGGGQVPEYQAGGKLLDGPGDGMSDDIPAVIRGKGVQRAALADGEFVIPADVVSHLGNGSTKAGAKKLYQMMDRIRQARTGNSKQAPAVKANKYLPA